MNAIRKRQKKNIFLTVKIGILTLLGQIFLAVGHVKEVTVNLYIKTTTKQV
jgi:hypothetical protein